MHDKLDRLVAEAYGWPETLSDEEILARLVKLNAERAAEEKRGLIRWLRPDYQRPRAGVVDTQAAVEEGAQLAAPLANEAKAQRPLFPTNDLERTAAVFAALMRAEKPLASTTYPQVIAQVLRRRPCFAQPSWLGISLFGSAPLPALYPRLRRFWGVPSKAQA